MQTYAVTSLVGGATPGTHFNDVYYMNHDGKYVLNDGVSSILKTTHPIHQISVSSGWVVDGVSITYNLESGNTTAMHHGSVFSPPTSVVSFGENEVLSAVYGREGYHTYYQRDLVTNIAFVIFDTNTEQSRTAGPFGNGDGTNQGQPFWTSDVLALGSFAQNTSTNGLSGLVFFKNLLNSTNNALTPPSKSAN